MSKIIKLSLITVAFLSQANAQEITLDSIKVTTATKSAQSIKDLTTNTVVITAQEIEDRRYTTVLDALKSVAGINITSNGGMGSTSSMQLRGMGNNRTLILIDGVSYQNPSSTSGANLSHLLASDIERIEIIKGAQSGVWGANASAGVINIITKSSQKGTHAKLNLEYGSYKSIKYGATLSHKTDDLELKLSANRITSDSFSVQSPMGDDVDKYEEDPYENTTINFKAGYKITDNIKVKFDITSISSLKDYDSYGNPDDDIMKSDSDTLLYSLLYLQKVANHHITLKYENSDFKREEIGTVAQYGSEYVKAFNGTIQNLELKDNFKYMKDSFLLFGVGIAEDEVDYIMTDNAETEKTNKASYLYATNSNKLEGLILTQSARYDNYDNFDDKLTAKVGAKYHFTDKIYLSSNIGSGYNTPNIVQELNPWGAVNDELNPENSLSFDASIGAYGAEITYFHQKIQDLIEWYDPDGWGGDLAIYKNLDGVSTFQGIEVSYKESILEDFDLSSNYTYLEAEDKDKKRLARRAKHTLNLNIEYYPLESLNFGISAKYTGERFNKADEEGVQTGKYVVSNFVTNYKPNKYLDIYLKVDNVGDKNYQEVDGYATAGRSYYIGLNAKY